MPLIVDQKNEERLLQDMRRRLAQAEAALASLQKGYERRSTNVNFIAVGPGVPIPGGA